MKLIVGLGNPGRQYARSRHNLGWVVVDALAAGGQKEGVRQWRVHQGAAVFMLKPNVFLVKPQLFVNHSGPPVARLARRKGIEAGDIWVVHDDLDLSLGEVRVVRRRGAGGHNGIRSLIEALGTNDFYRFRLGIGRPSFGLPLVRGKQRSKFFSKERVEEYVLSSFLTREADDVRRVVDRAVALITASLDEGIEAARRGRQG